MRGLLGALRTGTGRYTLLSGSVTLIPCLARPPINGRFGSKEGVACQSSVHHQRLASKVGGVAQMFAPLSFQYKFVRPRSGMPANSRRIGQGVLGEMKWRDLHGRNWLGACVAASLRL